MRNRNAARYLPLVRTGALPLLLGLLLLATALGPARGGSPVGPPAAPSGPAPAPAISPVLNVSPTYGPVGSTITASGSGFPADSTILLAVDGNVTASRCRSDSAGNVPGTSGTPCTFDLPVAPAGDRTITAEVVASVANLAVGSSPFGVAYDPAQDEAFVATGSSAGMEVILAANNSLAGNFSTASSGPWAVACDPASGEVFATSYFGGVVMVINATNDSPVATIGVGSGPYGIADDPALHELFVPNSGSGNVSVIDDASNSVVASIAVGSSPYGAAYDARTGQVFVTNSGSNNVSVLDAATNTVVASVGVGANPTGVAYDPALGELFVANYLGGGVSVINDTTDRVVAMIGVGSSPAGVTWVGGLGAIAVANAGSDNVSLLAPATDSVVASFPVGTAPEVIGYDPVERSLFVTDYVSDNVTVLGIMPQGNATLAVNASLSVSPSGAPSGATVVADGTGFAARAIISLSLDGTTLNSTCSSDGTGTFPGDSGTTCDFTVLASPPGPANVTASDGTHTATTVLLIEGGLRVSPTSGAVGSVVTASGLSFAADAAITLSIAGTRVSSNCSTDVYGSFPGASGTNCTFPVPGIPGGSWAVSASDGTTTGQANFTVVPSDSVSPTNGTRGATASARGAGFAPNSAVTLSVGGIGAPTVCATDAAGEFPGTSGTGCAFTVPTVPGGNESVVATDASTSASALNVGGRPFGVALDPRLGEVFVASSYGDNLTVLYASNGTRAGSVALGSFSPWAIAYDPVEREMFVTSFEGGTVLVLNDSTRSIVTTISVGSGPYGLCYDAKLGEMFVAVSGSDWVSVIDDATDTAIANITAGYGPYAVACDAGNDQVYVTQSGGDELGVIDAMNRSITSETAVGYNPTGVAYDPLAGELFVANYWSANVSVVNDTTQLVVGTIAVGSNPSGVAFDAGSGDIFVANAGSDDVSMIDPDGNAVARSIAVGSAPEVIAAGPASELIYVTNYFSSNLSIVAFPERASVGFLVNATLALVPARAQADAGQSLTLEATGFAASAGISTFSLGTTTLMCSRATVGTCLLGSLATDYAGSVRASFYLPPAVATNDYVLKLADAAGDSASLSLRVDADPSVSVPTASPASIDLGQTVSFGVAASLGSGGFVYRWSGLPAGCSGNIAPTSCAPGATGTFHVSVAVTDSNGFTVVSPVLNFTVSSDPTVTLPVGSPTSGAVDAGQSVTFSTTAVLGSSAYTGFTWYGLPSGCSGTTAAVTCSGVDLPAGFYTVRVSVTDSNNYTSALGVGLPFAVDADPTVGVPTSSVASADVGQSITFAVSAVLGAGPYAYLWSGLPAGCLGTTTSQVSCRPVAPGPLTVVVNVTDANGFSRASPALALTIYPDPIVTVSADRSSLDVRTPLVLTADATGGSGGYRYGWTGLPAGCPGSVDVVTCVPPIAGVYDVAVTATDSDGGSATSAAVQLVVTSLPSVGISIIPDTAAVGELVFFNATSTGGSGQVNFTWQFGDGASASGRAVQHAFRSAGQFGVTVWANDSGGGSYVQVVNLTIFAPGSTSAGWTALDTIGVAAVIVVVVAVAVLLMVRRRSNATPESEPPAPDPSDGFDPAVPPPTE